MQLRSNLVPECVRRTIKQLNLSFFSFLPSNETDATLLERLDATKNTLFQCQAAKNSSVETDILLTALESII